MHDTLNQFIAIAKELLEDESKNPVAEFVPAEKLHEELDLSLSENGISNKEFKAALTDLVLKTPRTATKAFFNQLFG